MRLHAWSSRPGASWRPGGPQLSVRTGKSPWVGSEEREPDLHSVARVHQVGIEESRFAFCSTGQREQLGCIPGAESTVLPHRLAKGKSAVIPTRCVDTASGYTRCSGSLGVPSGPGYLHREHESGQDPSGALSPPKPTRLQTGETVVLTFGGYVISHYHHGHSLCCQWVDHEG